MYIDNTVINVLSNEYDKNNKPFTVTSHQFKFDDGINAKNLAKFLESLEETQGGRFSGSVMATITIDTRDYK
jgi:hypothetical protein